MHLLFGFSLHEGFGLGKEVGDEDYVVFTQGVECSGRSQKVAGDDLGALVDQLIKGMLPVGTGLSPDDWSC